MSIFVEGIIWFLYYKVWNNEAAVTVIIKGNCFVQWRECIKINAWQSRGTSVCICYHKTFLDEISSICQILWFYLCKFINSACNWSDIFGSIRLTYSINLNFWRFGWHVEITQSHEINFCGVPYHCRNSDLFQIVLQLVCDSNICCVLSDIPLGYIIFNELSRIYIYICVRKKHAEPSLKRQLRGATLTVHWSRKYDTNREISHWR